VPDLRPYQAQSVDFLAGKHHALLAHEMRLGKTPCAIVAAHKAGARSIAVVTQAIAVPQWEAEIERWWPSGPLPRRKVWSYAKATDLWKDGLRGTVDVFIPDECHFAKNPEAFRTKMVYGKDGLAWNAGATWALSGTPAPKHAGELWPMLRAFGVVKMTYLEFARYFCYSDPGGRVLGTNVSKIPELKGLLKQIMLRRTRAQVAPEMPAIDYQFLNINPLDVDLDPALRGLDADALDGREDDKEDRIAVALAKVPSLVDHIEFAIENGLLKQTVVFGWHVEPLRALVDALDARGISGGLITGATTPTRRAKLQDEFKRGLPVLAANILAAGTAIDLSAASHGYFLELDWVSGNNVQAANRLISMDKSEPVTFDVVTWPGSTDDWVQKVLLRRVRELSKIFT
jgi:SNF2 family DNA or RNA helicase